MAQENQNRLNGLNERDNGKIEEKSHEFLRKLHDFIGNYVGQLPNLRDIFRPEAVEWLLTESVTSDTAMRRRSLVNFVINTGYKDEPKVDEDGKILLHRTTPVHLTIKYYCDCEIFKIYDRFDVNYTDENGLTHFHAACMLGCTDVVEKFLDLGQDPNLIVTKTGESPLYVALRYDRKEVYELLLRRGANPNLVDDNGNTPLHQIMMHQRYRDEEWAKIFFEICDEQNQSVKIDARDNSDQTPLELAAANLLPNTVDVLLNYGADLSSFVFPTEDDFDEELQYEDFSLNFQYGLASGAMAVVEQLEKRGYELKRSDALTIMALFKKYKLFEKSKDNAKCWYNRKHFAIEAKKVLIKPSLSLYDLIRLKPEEAAKILTYMDYYELVESNKLWRNSSEKDDKACCMHLCETVSRKFFRRWGLDHFMELTHYRLPHLCCDMIIKQLKNKDLWRICLATTGQSS